MQTFQWNPSFLTGLMDVDEQHHHLIDLINHLGTVITRPEGVMPSELESIFSTLADYTQHHFSNEEAMMVRKRLLPAYITSHRRVHDTFLDEIALLYRYIKREGIGVGRTLFSFLTHWITFHILGKDQCMARQIRAIETGTSPEDAYLARDNHHDPATEALLSALNGLFSIVSQRNQQLLELNATLEARVTERTQALLEANQRLRTIANTDGLTGLPNRRRALHILSREWEHSQEDSTPLACMMLDADGFKGVNDTYGHDAGDMVLRNLAQCLQHAVRPQDVACRLGGDEFFIICPCTTLDEALDLAHKVLRAVNALVIPLTGGHWRGRTSIGVAIRTEAMHNVDNLIKKADKGLYAAKQKGRNRVECVQDFKVNPT